MLPKIWLEQFLAAKRIIYLDRMSLYRYHLLEEQFHTLKTILKTSANFGVNNLISVQG